ncbi:dsba-like thioredoxin domain-containing protein [Apodospora peruviana]|uniref:Dsba-like thioredoxin domain-containing protein n=1 Tax=Apodospora peruviana TaxID=516989 RepID=A0AAE0MH24_9PEZI|nr:dsba-like thioredoxin domain-containing protein [Apodospora peruviana]
MTIFTIKITSDPVCPQCYLGKKRLDRAIQLYKRVIPDGKHDTFIIEWLPFYLDRQPTTARTDTQLSCNTATKTCNQSSSMPLADRMLQRFGGSATTAEAMQACLRSKGQNEGISFSFGSRIGSTRDAHRLIHFAGLNQTQQNTRTGEIQNSVVTELFRRYFEEDGDITSHHMLVEVGEQAGLDAEEVRDWLRSDQGGQEVDDLADQAVREGVKGVPVFVITATQSEDGDHGRGEEKVQVDGAQDVEDFLGEFTRLCGRV